MSEPGLCPVCGRDLISLPDYATLLQPNQCARGSDSWRNWMQIDCWKQGYARLESELREARAELEKHEGCMTEAAKDFDESLGQCLDRAEKAESALSAERTARRVMREALEGALPWLERYAPTMADNARAALAAEPGKGPGGPAALGHPRAAEGAATPKGETP